MARTNFEPAQHGFAFPNSWRLKPEERTRLRQTLARSTGEATSTLGNDPFGFVRTMVSPQLAQWIETALPDTYGLCGGMAFAAADYFRAGKPVPHGITPNLPPDSDAPLDQAVRDYLWKRQLDSLAPNAPVLLSWMAMLFLPLPGAGPGWLLERTREQFTNLKGFLAQGQPWPICLIGSSTSPFNNHQVLAIGVDDPGDGTGVIFVYDANCPGRAQTIGLDMRGAVLQATESCPSAERGALRGFFCEHYTPAPPPELPPGSQRKPAP